MNNDYKELQRKPAYTEKLLYVSVFYTKELRPDPKKKDGSMVLTQIRNCTGPYVTGANARKRKDRAEAIRVRAAIVACKESLSNA